MLFFQRSKNSGRKGPCNQVVIGHFIMPPCRVPETGLCLANAHRKRQGNGANKLLIAVSSAASTEAGFVLQLAHRTSVQATGY